MSAETRQPQLEMERDSLEGLPEATTPEGYRLRTYRPGDEAGWSRLLATCIGGNYTESSFLSVVSGSAGFDPQGMFFAERDGQPVGTACAVWMSAYPPEMGYVHMVAVDPEHRGQGLGRALTLKVLHRLRQRGFRRAVLQTDDFRLPALRLYLSLGFRPRFSHESHP